VKNLRKDGGYYWVLATIIPRIRQGQILGYTSIRREPARSKVAELSQEYARLLEREQSVGGLV
jgi:aerotaxis receptor